MISRQILLAAAGLAFAVAGTGTANASLSAGQWDINGIRQICLLSTGTWYGVTFGPWNGRWEAVPQPNSDRYIIYGNYNGGSGFGSGNTSMGVNKANQANWTDWVDGTPGTFLGLQQMTKVKKQCDRPAGVDSIGGGGKGPAN